jgi:Immunity protein 50
MVKSTLMLDAVTALDEDLAIADDGIVALIIDAHSLTSIYGRWPTFQGAEVYSLMLDRSLGSPLVRRRLTVVFLLAGECDDIGFANQRALARIHFDDVQSLDLSGFAGHETIDGLHIEVACGVGGLATRLQVSWHGPSTRDNVSFVCERIEVAAVEPYGSH